MIDVLIKKVLVNKISKIERLFYILSWGDAPKNQPQVIISFCRLRLH